MTSEQSRTLKGGKFHNRYVIKATFTALTPFHIGDGTEVEREGMIDNKTMKRHQINAVTTDGNGHAYIPGSTLRGALRDWLRQGNTGMTENMNGDTASDIAKFSDLERIFGTQHNEGKLEVWDAYCTTSVQTPTDVNGQMCFWHKERLTYVAKSVAIDPQTGTAEDGKLYNYELVPSGATFAVTLSAQNLSTEEEKLLMAVLNGFHQKDDNPITIGAMTKLDFGRFDFDIDGFKIYRLDATNIEEWRVKAKNPEDKRAGYDLLVDEDFAMKEEERKELLAAKLPDPIPVIKHSETWTLNLETPLVVRSGSSAGWKNSAKSKTRNYKMEFKWDATPHELRTTYDQVGDLYHSLKIEGDKVVPYYHVPSSSVRGALRAWTIEHLLPKDWRKIETKLKAGDLTQKPAYFDNILSLFGFAIEGANKKITHAYTKAGRLSIRVEPFKNGQVRPVVGGNDWNNTDGDNFGPANAIRHIKPRNPLDRITQAAKEGGLHNFLEFSKGQTLTISLKIREPEEFDKQLLTHWKDEVCSGMIRFGGLSGIGRGRVNKK